MSTTTKKFGPFEGRKMKPTRKHRVVAWGGILGTIYARNQQGEVRYFDYDYEAAQAWVGEVLDIRIFKAGSRTNQYGATETVVWAVSAVEVFG